jgi:RNA polymerase sigma-70 factor (ECF subfamily)
MAEEAVLQSGDWVEKAKAGDTAAFEHIYDELVKPVYRYIYYRVDPQVAEDLTEETFLKVWQNLKQYKKGQHPFSSWVFKIAHNLVCDYYRKNQIFSEIDEGMAAPEESHNPSIKVNLRLNQIKLRKAITKLPEQAQQVIILKYINDLSNEEIAQVTGKTEGAVRIIQFRALKQLRGILEEKRQDF